MTKCQKEGGYQKKVEKVLYCPKLKVFFNIAIMGGVISL